jgi:hypothetical protein
VEDTANKFEVFNEAINSYFLMFLLCITGQYYRSVSMTYAMIWLTISTLLIYLAVHITFQF